MTRPKFDLYSRRNQLVIDGTIFACSYAAAYLIRFETSLPWSGAKQFLLWLPYVIAGRLVVNWLMGIYRFIWRYVSLSDAVAIARSLSIITGLWLVLRFFYPSHALFSQWLRLPLSVIALEYLMSLLGSLGARALRRILYERGQRNVLASIQSPKRAVLYGAGRSGIMLLKELRNHAEVEVVGFVDDDPKKVGTIIMGAMVLGDGSSLAQICRQQQVDEVVISIATAGRRAVAKIAAQCGEIPVTAKIIPSLQEIVEGRVSISQFREVRIEDLLGRDRIEVKEFEEEVRKTYAGKRILVTGAGGSIGSELVRQLLLFGPDSVALLDKDENSTYELEQELRFQYPDARIEPQIADIRHRGRLEAIFKEVQPEVVFHAAAHKHVPLMEKHPCEAVLNNVYGTQTLLETCRAHGVKRFTFISTDKAVKPTSVMGATKRLGEMLVQAFADGGSLVSACVRFGNVMGSRGSVIPLFQKQIANGGPITVTHPEVLRFFMTIPEAVQLVLCAASLGGHGEVYMLDMGDPRSVLDLAREMIRLSGMEPEKDIEISITGLRPGEKLVEELVMPSENVSPTQFKKLMKVSSDPCDDKAMLEGVGLLIQAAEANDPQGIYKLLCGMNLDFCPGGNPNV